MICDSSRLQLIEAFLTKAGWGGLRPDWLGQDASTRRYARLSRQSGQTALLMDAPPVESPPCTPDMTVRERHEQGWNALTRLAASRVDAFVLIADHLRSVGLRPPEIYAYDAMQGLALIEDFGKDREFARRIELGEDEVPLYAQAAQDLAHLHAQPIPDLLNKADISWPVLEFDTLALATNADLYADWFPRYDQRVRMRDTDLARWERVRDTLISQAGTFPRAFTLRDYHAENLLWLESEQRIGLLDFQDAVIGWDAWDMAMLTQDARRHVSAPARSAAIKSYLEASGAAETAFLERLAIIGALNALRITGVFSRLIIRDQKPRYNQFMPRQQALLAENLRHPAAAELRDFISQTAGFILEPVS